MITTSRAEAIAKAEEAWLAAIDRLLAEGRMRPDQVPKARAHIDYATAVMRALPDEFFAGRSGRDILRDVAHLCVFD